MRDDLIARANDYARQFNAVAEQHGFDLPMEVLAALCDLFAAALSAQGETAEEVVPAGWVRRMQDALGVSPDATYAAMLEKATAHGETAPAPVDLRRVHVSDSIGLSGHIIVGPPVAVASPLPPGEALAKLEKVLSEYDLQDEIHGLEPWVEDAVVSAITALRRAVSEGSR